MFYGSSWVVYNMSSQNAWYIYIYSYCRSRVHVITKPADEHEHTRFNGIKS